MFKNFLKTIGIVIVLIIIVAVVTFPWTIRPILFTSTNDENEIYMEGKGHEITLDGNDPNKKCFENKPVIIWVTLNGIANHTSVQAQAICENDDQEETTVAQTVFTNTGPSMTNSGRADGISDTGQAKCKITYVSEESLDYDWKAVCSFGLPWYLQ